MPATQSLAPEILEKVPPFPPVAAKLLSVLAQSDVEVREVAQLIGSDATFTAHLLRRVNSYEFGLSSPVTNIQQAVAIAGLDRTREIIMTQATAAYTQGALRAGELRRCWEHSIATAVLADEIARACGGFKDAAFTAGIMHDIGRLGLVVAYPDRYERVIRDAAVQCLDLLDFEQEEFGVNHSEAGRFLAEKWGLPEDLLLVAGRHHDTSGGGELDLVQVVHLACRMADSLGYDVVRPLTPVHVNKVARELPFAARQRFSKTPEQLCALIEEQIKEFNSDPTRVAPAPPVSEEPEAAQQPETSKVSDKVSDGEDEMAFLALMDEPSAEQPSEPQRSSVVVTVAWVAAGVVCLVALLLWKLR